MLHLTLDLGAVLLLALGLKGLSKVRTARTANGLAAVALVLAVLGLLLEQGLTGWSWMLLGLAAGGGAGALVAYRVPMTSMPEVVALFNGCGGMSSLLVALGAAALPKARSPAPRLPGTRRCSSPSTRRWRATANATCATACAS